MMLLKLFFFFDILILFLLLISLTWTCNSFHLYFWISFHSLSIIMGWLIYTNKKSSVYMTHHSIKDINLSNVVVFYRTFLVSIWLPPHGHVHNNNGSFILGNKRPILKWINQTYCFNTHKFCEVYKQASSRIMRCV